MEINPNIFKEYDVRGIYPGEVDINVAYRIGVAFSELLKKEGTDGTVLVGHDARLSSPELLAALMRGIADHGRNIIDIGLASTPLFYFSVEVSGSAGGVMVTASHNPRDYNGFKFAKKGLVPLKPDDIPAISALALSTIPPARVSGSARKTDFSEKYVDFLVSKENIKRRVRFAIDASNGSAGNIIQKTLSRLLVDYDPILFLPDGSFPNHSPNPLDEESLNDISKRVIEKAHEFGVVVDGDGDRLSFVDQNGRRIRNDIIACFLADFLVQKGDVVVSPVTATHALKELVEKKGGTVVFSRVGHVNMKRAMREHDAIFGAEPSGHFYFKDFYYCASAILTLIHFISNYSAVVHGEMSISDIIKPYEKYFHSGELSFRVKDREKIIDHFKLLFEGAKQDTFDGLTVEYPDWWFNIRLSNTEPLVRLVVEAATKELLEQKRSELIGKIKLSQ